MIAIERATKLIEVLIAWDKDEIEQLRSAKTLTLALSKHIATAIREAEAAARADERGKCAKLAEPFKAVVKAIEARGGTDRLAPSGE